MTILSDATSKLDQKLFDTVLQQIKDQSYKKEDLQNYFKLFGQICNHSDEIKFEMANYFKTFQFDIGGQKFFITFEKGKCSTGAGEIENPQLTFTIEDDIAGDILMGRVHVAVAHMNGDVIYKGIRNDALQFKSIFELFLEEFK